MSALLRKASLFEDETDLELLTINKVMLKKYGTNFVEWESETLKEAVNDDFGPLGEITWQKMQAGRLLLKNNACWLEWEVFENVCCAIMGEFAIFSQTQPPEPEDLVVTLETLSQVADHEFHKDVIGYIASACLFDGLWCLPEHLVIAQQAIEDHDSFNGFSRDYSGPKTAARGRRKLYVTPSTMSEAQANRMISVTNTLHEFKAKLAAEDLNAKEAGLL